MAKSLTQKELKKILWYLPDEGMFFRVSTAAPADVDTGRGYKQAYVNGKYYYSHRLAFLYMTGRWPRDDIDHIDGNKSNNKWTNLREATRSQNFMNKPGPSRALPTGVQEIANGRYRARVKIDKKEIHGGYFDSKEEAARKAEALRKAYFKEYRFKS